MTKSEYDHDYPHQVKQHLAEGKNLNSFASKVGVCYSTVLNWKKRHPEFGKATEVGETKEKAWYEDKLRDKVKEGSEKSLHFALSRRFGWREQREIKGVEDWAEILGGDDDEVEVEEKSE